MGLLIEKVLDEIAEHDRHQDAKDIPDYQSVLPFFIVGEQVVVHFI